MLRIMIFDEMMVGDTFSPPEAVDLFDSSYFSLLCKVLTKL